MAYPGKGISTFDNGENEVPEGFPPIGGGEKGMMNVFESLFPRKEHHPNRKVGKKDLYGKGPNS